MITQTVIVTASAALLFAGLAGPASAYHSADASYGECISGYNSGDRSLHGTPGQNTYPDAENPLPADEVAKLRNEVREEHCASAKKVNQASKKKANPS